jgi:hypothetical protein
MSEYAQNQCWEKIDMSCQNKILDIIQNIRMWASILENTVIHRRDCHKFANKHNEVNEYELGLARLILKYTNGDNKEKTLDKEEKQKVKNTTFDDIMNILSNSEDQHEALMNHMEQCRQRLKEQNKSNNLSQRISNILNETGIGDQDRLIKTTNDSRNIYLKPSDFAHIDEDNIDIEDPRVKELSDRLHNNEILPERLRKIAESYDKRKKEILMEKRKKLYEESKILEPDDKAQNAPFITPLFSLTESEREELFRTMFNRARNNIKSLLGDKYDQKTPDEKQELVSKEADRLIDNYIESRKKNK